MTWETDFFLSSSDMIQFIGGKTVTMMKIRFFRLSNYLWIFLRRKDCPEKKWFYFFFGKYKALILSKDVITPNEPRSKFFAEYGNPKLKFHHFFQRWSRQGHPPPIRHLIKLSKLKLSKMSHRILNLTTSSLINNLHPLWTI